MILVLATIVRLISLHFPFGDYDEGVYTASVRSVINGHPLISQTYSSQGPLFIYISEIFYRLSNTLTALRLFPVLCALVTIFLVFKLVDKIIGRSGAVFASSYLAFNSIFLTISRNFQVDIPWTAFSFISLYFLLEFEDTKNSWHITLSALFFGMSILMKASPLLIAVIASYFLLSALRNGVKYLKNVLYFLVIPFLLLLIMVPFNELRAFYINTVGIRVANIAPELSAWSTGVRSDLIKHEFLVILMSFLSVIILIFKNVKQNIFKIFEENMFLILSMIWLLVTFAAFSFYADLFPHHLVFFVLPNTLVAAYAVNYLFENAKNKFIEVFCFFFIIALIFYQGVFNYGGLGNILLPKEGGYSHKLRVTSEIIRKTTSKNDWVISDDQITLFLADRNTPPDMVDTSFVRIRNKLLTLDDMVSSLQKYKPKEVVYVSGRFDKIPRLAEYLTENNYKMTEYQQGIRVYILDDNR